MASSLILSRLALVKWSAEDFVSSLKEARSASGAAPRDNITGTTKWRLIATKIMLPEMTVS